MRVTEITRAAILDQLLLAPRPFHGRMDLVAFLKRIWDLSSMPSTDVRFNDAAGDIWQHMVNNDDWTYEYLLSGRLNLLACDDPTFLRFLETCLHPLAVADDDEASALAGDFSSLLEKDGYSLVISQRVSGRAIYRAIAVASGAESSVYEVVLSFAGEERGYVETVASLLKNADVSLFYDRYEEVTLWGKDLTEHLDKVYRSARYCVMFVSRNYADKVWTNHERKSALARAVQEKGEYILPVRFDDTELPGLRHSLGYVDARVKSPEQVTEMILRKLGRDGA